MTSRRGLYRKRPSVCRLFVASVGGSAMKKKKKKRDFNFFFFLLTIIGSLESLIM